MAEMQQPAEPLPVQAGRVQREQGPCAFSFCPGPGSRRRQNLRFHARRHEAHVEATRKERPPALSLGVAEVGLQKSVLCTRL